MSRAEKILWVAAPSAKRYDSGTGYQNSPSDFISVSVTGAHCGLNCAHCGRRLLESMHDVSAPGALADLVPQLVRKGAYGILVSGGADTDGSVPLTDRFSEIRRLKQAGLKVVVHTGLVGSETAHKLKEVGVDQVLFDLIGDDATIRDVYHLPFKASDYRQALEGLCAAGLTVIPHVVAGLNYGNISNGERHAIKWAAEYPVPGLVIVTLAPLPGTVMAKVVPPSPAMVGELFVLAREAFTGRTLLMGCARPANADKAGLERIAVDAGVDGIAYASSETIRYAEATGYTIKFFSGCCSLVATG